MTDPTNIEIDRQRIDELTADALKLLRLLQPRREYYGAFSGGKDSIVLEDLCVQAGVAVDWHLHVTTIEPPELLYFVRKKYPHVNRDRPTRSFFALARDLGFPTRRYRWCCRHLKENHCPRQARMLLGVRAAESPARAKSWEPVAWHHSQRVWTVCPLFNWKDADVWSYIALHKMQYCSLYDEGFKRIGCVGCPLCSAADRRRHFDRWPHIAERFRELMRYLWQRRCTEATECDPKWSGDNVWTSATDMFEWYVDHDQPGKETCGTNDQVLADA